MRHSELPRIPMKKTFSLEHPRTKPARLADGYRNEVKRYLKRERGKMLPEGFDVWVFDCDVPIEKIVIQEEEVCNVMWASVEKIKELYIGKKFEANLFFEEALKCLSEDVYYIGFNANNAICNEEFFSGSITFQVNY